MRKFRRRPRRRAARGGEKRAASLTADKMRRMKTQLTPLPLNLHDEFDYGVMHRLSPAVRRTVARNPGRFTFLGTGTYIVGNGSVAVIDPGPHLPEHVDAIIAGLDGETISHILVTHHHSDHSPASRLLQEICGAPIYGRRAPAANRPDERESCAEEEADQLFVPDVEVEHGDLMEGDGWSIECVRTPGHTSNHVCYRFREEKALFSGDHVMGWSTSVIIPPDGRMSDYLRSLRLLLEADDARFYPTHGAAVERPKELLRAYLQHRKEREAQIVECLESGMSSVQEMVPVVYESTDPALHAAASLSLFATLLMLVESGQVRCDGAPALDSTFRYEP